MLKIFLISSLTLFSSVALAITNMSWSKSAASCEIISPSGCSRYFDNTLNRTVMSAKAGCRFECYGFVPDLSTYDSTVGTIELHLTTARPTSGVNTPGNIEIWDGIGQAEGADESYTFADATHENSFAPTYSGANLPLHSEISTGFDIRVPNGVGLTGGTLCSSATCALVEMKIVFEADTDITGSDEILFIDYGLFWIQDQ